MTPSEPPPGRAPLLGVLWAALGLDLALLLGLWAVVPGDLVAGPLRLAPGWVDVAVPLALVLGVALAVVHAGPARSLERLAGFLRSRLAGASPGARLRLAAATLMTLAALDGLLGAPQASLRLRVAQAASDHPSLTHNRDHHHLPALVDAVAARPVADPVVVHVEDDDPRGHVAAYYAYPRLLLMAPARRAWTVRARMDHLGVPDPTLPPAGAAPDRDTSARFAAERGADLLVLRGSRTLAPEEAGP